MEAQQNKATILAVDDSRVMLVAASKALKEEFEVLKASNGEQAWETIQQHPEISMIFSDLEMPYMNGHELLSLIRSSEDTRIANLPVVILTGHEDDDGTKKQVMKAGATDFISKPFKSLDILSRAQSLSRLSKQVNELEQKVSLDKLTRLYTETSFNESGERATAYAMRHARSLTVLRFDIDNFTKLYQSHGKQKTEAILCKIASLTKSILRQEDIAARISSAKFSLLLIESDQEDSGNVVERLRSILDETDFSIPEKISISIGSTSPIVEENITFADIKKKAEQALQKALACGEGQTVYSEAAEQQAATDQTAKPRKIKLRIDLTAVLREVERNKGKRLGEKQLNATLNSMLPILKFLNTKMSLDIDDAIEKLADRLN